MGRYGLVVQLHVMEKKCICGNSFVTSLSRVRVGRGKYCSKACMYKYCPKPKKGRKVTFNENSKKGWFKKGQTSWHAGTKGLVTAWNKGIKGTHFSPGTEFKYKNGNGYRHLLLSGKLVQECANCGENNIKRLHVHHKDHNRKNNSIDNLKVLCRPCHLAYHGKKERVYVEGRKAVL